MSDTQEAANKPSNNKQFCLLHFAMTHRAAADSWINKLETMSRGSRNLILILLVLLGIMSMQLSRVTTELNDLKKNKTLKTQTAAAHHYRVESLSPPEGTTAFQKILSLAFQSATEIDFIPRKEFQLAGWIRGTGGLTDKDRALLVKYYSSASSVFEYGLGESTLIASHVGVPRYAGTDSAASWVTGVRDQVQPHFRFYFADIGPIRDFGNPLNTTLPKNAYNYELAPLAAEPLPFDVYLVDGRYRVGSLLASVLHSSDRGGNPETTHFLIHDCEDPTRPYHMADHLLRLVEQSGDRLCVYQRMANTTDDQFLNLWNDAKFLVAR